ncbi:MAG TPA: Gfo/Idh/MocA family oxidoreductase [Pseudonocardia sp.]|nr:Gfo/Idh/MocA family oxidoreductase [Pseudonocardia sp.]
MTPPLRFALVGCGVIGQVHARSIAALGDRARLVLTVDAVADRAAKLAAEHGAAHSTSVAEALARDDVDAVAVCTPSGLHAETTIAALAAGRHVVVEKPLDVTVAAVRRVEAARLRSGRAVTVISQHRFDPASQLVHRAIRAGQLGRLTSGVASIAWWRSQDYYDSGDWRGTWHLDGGGALMNQGIHTIDLLVWLLGEPVEVFGATGCLAHRGIEVEDTAVATIRFAGGALGVVHGTTAAYPGLTARLQVHGDRGSAVIDNDELAYFHAAGAGDVPAPAYGAGGTGADGNQAALPLPRASRAAGAGSDPAALSEAHVDQYRDFVDAVAQGRPPLVTVADAGRTLAVVRAIYDSAEAGTPVALTSTNPAPA